jgi:hypothetical protein
MFPPMRIPILLLLAAAAPSAAAAQTTRAERTDYRETSSHADVLAFLDSLQTGGAAIRVGTLGQSPEGRRIPYVIAAASRSSTSRATSTRAKWRGRKRRRCCSAT